MNVPESLVVDGRSRQTPTWETVETTCGKRFQVLYSYLNHTCHFRNLYDKNLFLFLQTESTESNLTILVKPCSNPGGVR